MNHIKTDSSGMPITGGRPAPRMALPDIVAMVLMIIGGINWGLVGALNLDLVALLFGAGTAASRAVYVLVGLAALYGIAVLLRYSRAP